MIPRVACRAIRWIGGSVCGFDPHQRARVLLSRVSIQARMSRERRAPVIPYDTPPGGTSRVSKPARAWHGRSHSEHPPAVRSAQADRRVRRPSANDPWDHSRCCFRPGGVARSSHAAWLLLGRSSHRTRTAAPGVKQQQCGPRQQSAAARPTEPSQARRGYLCRSAILHPSGRALVSATSASGADAPCLQPRG